MAEIVNLRQARKSAAKAERDAAADANRVAFGLSKPSKEKARRENARAEAHLDGVRRGGVADASADGRVDR